MKKLITLVMVWVFGFSFVSCGKLQKIKDREWSSGFDRGWDVGWQCGHKSGWSRL